MRHVGKNAIVAVVAAAMASPASGNVWQHATDRDAVDLSGLYETTMRDADDQVAQASTQDSSPEARDHRIEGAIAEYKAAAKLKPDAGEPWFRIAEVIYSFRLECDPRHVFGTCPFDRKQAEAAVDALNRFEAASPLDPRWSVTGGQSELLFRRALLNTKLVTKDHLAAAASDYEKILARSTSTMLDGDDRLLGNLAETYMMLDRLPEAIDTYRDALRHGGGISTAYGLAVALDRDGQGEDAVDTVLSVGPQALKSFEDSVNSGDTFYVPTGEVDYYYALLDEAFGDNDNALVYWREYIASNAHPEFQPRARQHIAALVAQRPATKPPRRPAPEIEDYLAP